MATTTNLYGAAASATMSVPADIGSGTSSTISENGMDQKATFGDYSVGASYTLTIPRPSDVPAGRRIIIDVRQNVSGEYLNVVTSNSADKFIIAYDLYNGTAAGRYLIGYFGGDTALMELISDGVDEWFQTGVDAYGSWGSSNVLF